MKHNEKEYIEGMLERTSKFFSPNDINKVTESTFAICGMGGVGSVTVELFARMAIKRFKLLDKDKYEYSNLNRQLFAKHDTIGLWKTDVAAQRINEINPFIDSIETFNVRINNQNVKEFISGSDIVIQTGDSPSCRIILEEAKKQRVPLVSGYCYPTGAYAQVFDFRNRECDSFVDRFYDKFKWKTKKLTEMGPEELDEVDKQLMHPPAATIGFVTNMTGILIGMEALKLLTGRGKVCHYPKRIDFNAFDLKLRIYNPNSVFNLSNYSRFIQTMTKMKNLRT